jgi:ubiquinone biosynthesis protein COQ9
LMLAALAGTESVEASKNVDAINRAIRVNFMDINYYVKRLIISEAIVVSGEFLHKLLTGQIEMIRF